MIKSVSLWHITPADLGVEFFDPTNTTLSADENLYRIVNTPAADIKKNQYSKADYLCVLNMRRFLSIVNERIKTDDSIVFINEFPNISGCIAKYRITDNMYCYVMVNGTALFFEKGENIKIEDERYFSIPTFYARQTYEDDYCVNTAVSPEKKPLYDFLNILWQSVGEKHRHFSASENYGNKGIPYTLCITMIDSPDLISNKVDETMKKNIRALLDTSAFNNVYNKEQWNTIKERIDNDSIDDLNLKELSENLVFADNWSGVLLAGNLSKNETCINWLIEFEIFLQSQWVLFDSYCENIVREDMSALQLQGVLNRVEFVKVKLENDISSNMEQSRHIMRNSLIQSSDINTIYFCMHGILTGKLRIKNISDERKKARFSMFSDLSLLIIALLQIYGVVGELVSKQTFTQNDIVTMAIMVIIAIVCVWVMIKGRS